MKGFAAVVLALVAATVAHSGPLAIFTDPGSHQLRFGQGFSLGSRFTVNAAGLEVTALGLYDTTGTGLLESHDIGLWDVTAGNTEVAQVTVASGAGPRLDNGFRYIDLGSPLALVDGDTYILAAYFNPGTTAGVNDQLRDCCTGGGSNAGTDSHFTGFLAAFTGSNTVGHLSEPNGTTAGTDYAGPNFEFTVPTPEAETFPLLGMGLAAVWTLRGKRK